jgi:hypothetical protein
MAERLAIALLALKMGLALVNSIMVAPVAEQGQLAALAMQA